MMLWLLLLAAVVSADDLPPSCSKPIFCDSDLLHHVQLARLYPDSKTFVDLELINDPNSTLAVFSALLNDTNNNPSRDQIKDFVDQHFKNSTVLEDWSPPDYTENPKFLNGIRDPKLRQFAKDVNAIWPTLGRKVKPEVFERPDFFSLVPITHGFIVPGGRFQELYYWDTYWIIEGLLLSDMKETVKGKLQNLIELLRKFGHIPNGSRWYYQERSQPPLLSAMVSLYFRETKDVQFLRDNLDALEMELEYWLKTQIVTFEKDGETYTLLRYFAQSEGPRPESYYEDYTDAQVFNSESKRREFYVDIKSAAESGWDFSTRWLHDDNGDISTNLTQIHTRDIIPVDLNSMFANALQNMVYYQALLGRPRSSMHWAYVAKQWRSSIDKVLWNDQDGIWYDYDINFGKHRKYFYPSNLSPLWMGVVDKTSVKARGSKILKYVQNSKALDFPGGLPTSLLNSNQQWDFPNAWPPLVSIFVNALEAINTPEAKDLALEVAENWVRVCYKGFSKEGHMYEKYHVERPGDFGIGGEYLPQTGFGWSNGVVLEFLGKYGRVLTVDDSASESADSESNDDSTSA